MPPQSGIATSPNGAQDPCESFHKSRQADSEISSKYKNQKPVISALTRIPRPSRRVYVSVAQLKRIKRGCFGREQDRPQMVVTRDTFRPSPSEIYVKVNSGGQNDLFSFMQGTLTPCTSKGIVPGVTALRLNIGGEPTCHVYQKYHDPSIAPGPRHFAHACKQPGSLISPRFTLPHRAMSFQAPNGARRAFVALRLRGSTGCAWGCPEDISRSSLPLSTSPLV